MDKLIQTLGLAYRASKVYMGEILISNMSSVHLLFVASDASNKTKERFEKKCFYYKIPCISTYTSAELSNAVGKSHIVAIGITDKGFFDSLNKEIERRSANAKTST